ncbi:MAG TPA: aminoacyl--tRNA ligase-related protein [Gemmatimonadaceae bacterium]|nr:aminoacyl--tRNA ligase-related protein [Gemmatimonadaceae bacterium]
MTPADLEAALLRFVNERLLSNGATGRVTAETPLFEHGYLNSIRVLDLIAFLERTLGHRIPDRTVKLANFRSVRAIVLAFAAPRAIAEPLTERLFERRTDATRFAAPIAGLREAGHLTEPAPGLVGLSGPPLDLIERIDAIALAWARELGATRHEFPALIPLDVLRRAGYLRSFPQHLTMAGHLERSDAVLTRAARDGEGVGRADLADPREALAPAVCYHCYPAFTGLTLGPEPVLLTARGRCFRHEPEAAAPLERLRDFTMREIIVLGTFEQVESARASLLDRAMALVALLDLDGVIEPASDPFFGPLAEARRTLQLAGALKYELRLSLESGRSVAVTSFNHHRDHFGRSFDIRLADGSVAHSGCVAFGLERWALAILTQHGIVGGRWPDALRQQALEHEVSA